MIPPEILPPHQQPLKIVREVSSSTEVSVVKGSSGCEDTVVAFDADNFEDQGHGISLNHLPFSTRSVKCEKPCSP